MLNAILYRRAKGCEGLSGISGARRAGVSFVQHPLRLGRRRPATPPLYAGGAARGLEVLGFTRDARARPGTSNDQMRGRRRCSSKIAGMNKLRTRSRLPSGFPRRPARHGPGRARRPTSKRPVPYCRKTWSPPERLAYYSTPDPLSGCHIWHGRLPYTLNRGLEMEGKVDVRLLLGAVEPIPGPETADEEREA